MNNQPIISIWGPVAAGKTVYVAGLILSLLNPELDNWNVSPFDEPARTFVKYQVGNLALGNFANPTERPYSLTFKVFRDQKESGDHIFRIFDTQGGMLERDYFYSGRQDILQQSEGIILLIDPTQDYSSGHFLRQIQEFFFDISASKLQSNGYLDMSIAICLTKIDQNWEMRNNPKDNLHRVLGQRVIDLITTNFESDRRQFFSTSVVGVQPDQSPNILQSEYRVKDLTNWQPYGLLEPFVWITENIEQSNTNKLPFLQKLLIKIFGRKIYSSVEIPKTNFSDNRTRASLEASTHDIDIFISYSRKNWNDHVKHLVAQLQEQGHRVWVDQYVIKGGDDWLDEINNALKASKMLILCVSSDAIESRYVRIEYRYFIDKKKPIIPLILEDVELPAELIRINYIEHENIDKLFERINTLKSKL